MSRKEEHMPPVFKFEPRNKAQEDAFALYKENTILFLLGPEGTGKTHVAAACAIDEIIRKRKQDIILVRPNVEAECPMGFLPGEVDEKLEPYMAPFRHVISKMSFAIPKGCLKVQPIAHCRGITFENCVVLVDEAQNLSKKALKLLMTRIGNNCKMIISGSITQCDIKVTVPMPYLCDLDLVADSLCDVPRIAVFDFEESDIVRNPIVREVLKRLP